MADVSSDRRGVSVTMKYKDAKGKGYDQPWVVFHGNTDEVFADIQKVYGLTGEGVAELTLHELVVNANRLAHNTSSAADVLGAVAIPASTSEAQVAEGGSAWSSGKDAAPAEPAVNPIFAEIEKAETVKDLQVLWAGNQAAFADEDVMAAYKARGKALQGASA